MSFNNPSNPDPQNQFQPAYTPPPSARMYDYDNRSYISSRPENLAGQNTPFGIVAFIMALMLPPVGFILSIIALYQAKTKAGNVSLATAGIIIGFFSPILILVLFALYIGSSGL